VSSICTVIDYGVGNLLSVSRAIEHVGGSVHLTDSAAAVDAAERLILPGVGAFADGMKGLAERGVIDAIKRYGASGRPLLGICLGMQLLFEVGEEFGRHEGLGLIPGRVAAIPASGVDGKPHKIPHIGWNQLAMPASRSSWEGSVLAQVPPLQAVYFVHSYTGIPSHPADRLADTYYNGQLISAAVARERIYGCQFHPEKSGEAGLRILRQFLTGTA
jgi:imidazole glycerol-phosphate synthase subunit HisH